MSGRRRFSGVVVGAVIGAVCVALAGCSGDPDGAATLPPVTTTVPSSPSATATETPTGDPTPTTTLTLFEEHDASVDAFVQQFFAAYNAAQDSRDLSEFEALYLPQCTGCIAMRDELAGWLADGQTIEGGDWHILQQNSSALPDRGDFDALVYRDSVAVLDSSGSLVSTVLMTSVQLATGGLLPSDGWRLEAFAVEDADK